MSQPPVRGFPSTPRSTINVPAVISLVLGLCFFIPVLSGLLAVIFGIVGLKRSRDEGVGGRGPAVAGTSLGLISTAIWVAIIVPVTLTWANSRPQKELGRKFIEDLSRKDIPAAAALSASTLGWDQMARLSTRLTTFGDYRRVQFESYVYHVVNGLEQWTLTGNAFYSKDFAPFTLVTIKQDGQWRVYRLILSKKVIATQPDEPPPLMTTRP